MQVITAVTHLSPLLELDGRFCGAQPPPPPEDEAIRATPGPGKTALVTASSPPAADGPGGGRFSFLARSSQPNEGTD